MNKNNNQNLKNFLSKFKDHPETKMSYLELSKFLKLLEKGIVKRNMEIKFLGHCPKCGAKTSEFSLVSELSDIRDENSILVTRKMCYYFVCTICNSRFEIDAKTAKSLVKEKK